MYVNGLPAPELTLTRGVSYTVVVETGGSEDGHPLYVTTDSRGGYRDKSEKQRLVTNGTASQIAIVYLRMFRTSWSSQAWDAIAMASQCHAAMAAGRAFGEARREIAPWPPSRNCTPA